MKAKLQIVPGRVSGRLTAVASAGRKPNTGIFWACRCEWGKVMTVRSSALRRGHTRSCGCLQRDAVTGNTWTVKVGTAFLNLYREYEKAARVRGLLWTLDGVLFRELTQAQCSYCGSAPNSRSRARSGEIYIYNGIDRKDNTVGYTPENCVTCCGVCNYMKADHSVDFFLSHVAKIAERRPVLCS